MALPLDQRVHQDRADRHGETHAAVLVLEGGQFNGIEENATKIG